MLESGSATLRAKRTRGRTLQKIDVLSIMRVVCTQMHAYDCYNRGRP
jgi:hypothetical protein